MVALDDLLDVLDGDRLGGREQERLDDFLKVEFHGGEGRKIGLSEKGADGRVGPSHLLGGSPLLTTADFSHPHELP